MSPPHGLGVGSGGLDAAKARCHGMAGARYVVIGGFGEVR